MHTWEQLPPEHLPRTLADREAQPLLRFLQMPMPGLLGTVKGGSRQAHGKSEGHERVSAFTGLIARRGAALADGRRTKRMQFAHLSPNTAQVPFSEHQVLEGHCRVP